MSGSAANQLTRIELPGKPLNVNRISQGSHWQVTKERKFWRDHAGTVAKFTRVKPVAARVVIHVHQQTTSKGRLPDAGANFHAVKGAVDGLVEVGVLVDDSPQYVAGLWLHCPTKGDRDTLTIELVEVPGDGS